MVEIGIVSCGLGGGVGLSSIVSHLNTVDRSFLGGLKVPRYWASFSWLGRSGFQSPHSIPSLSTSLPWAFIKIGGGPSLMQPGVFLPEPTFLGQRSGLDLPDSDFPAACSIPSVLLGLVRLDLPRHSPVAHNNSSAFFSLNSSPKIYLALYHTLSKQNKSPGQITSPGGRPSPTPPP